MNLLGFFRRKPDNTEAARRTRLLRAGRIADGTIIDIGANADGQVTHIFYAYEINGVEYESSQLLAPEQLAHANDYAPGARITIRFDPHQPTNSIVV